MLATLAMIEVCKNEHFACQARSGSSIIELIYRVR